ncbi:hypothetical protein [Planotetraspora phitsanulokensis]|nr:hypothetical protein [Planotetraspora phitsanulokensis]
MAESTYAFPADLLQAQRDFFAAEARVKELCDALPSSIDVANMEAEITDEQREALQAARAEQLDLVMKLHRHEWWSTVDNRHLAGLELRKAAKA